MVDEVITIPEMQETLTASGGDFAVVRQVSSSLDKKVTLQTLKGYFTPPASLVAAGIVQLNNTVNSTSVTEAATPNSVRITYEFANNALLTAQAALNGLSGKANTVHTHNTSDIVAGVFSQARLPIGNSNQFGIVAHTNSLANPVGDSAAGYVPSLQLVQAVNALATNANIRLNTLAVDGTYNRWDGGSTGLNVAQGLLSLGAAPANNPILTGNVVVSSDFIQIGNNSSTFTRYSRWGQVSLNGGAWGYVVNTTTPSVPVGLNLLTTNAPATQTYPRVNADQTITYRDVNGVRSDLGISVANELTTGLTTEATQAEVNAGSAVSKFVTPAKIRSGFTLSGGTTGYFGLPTWLGGFMIKWGQVNMSGNSSLDVTNFGSELYLPFACCGNDDNGDRATPHAAKVGNTVRIRNTDAGSQLINWFAFGRN